MHNGMYTGDQWQAKCEDILREIRIAKDAPGGGGFDRSWVAKLEADLTDLFTGTPLAEGTTPYRATVGAGGTSGKLTT